MFKAVDLLRKQMTSLISPAYLLDMQILKNISGKIK